MPLLDRAAELAAECASWRRDLHRHPELLFDVPRTAGFVAERLRAFGLDEVVTGLGRSGVVGVVRGRSTASGRVIALRADMDALPITEATNLPWASQVPGRMHACGHDGHTAMLLGAARHLAETRRFDGTAVLVFQPAEEGGGGGRAMVEDGLMERFGVQEVYGLHNWPGLPVGAFALRPGPMMAAADHFDIEITGRGGHAAGPHTTIDTVLVAAQVVQALQAVVARNVDPLEAAVISVCAIHAGEAHNVIPQTARLKGTARSLTEPVRDLLESRLRGTVEGICAAFGATAGIGYRRGYPVTVNHPAETGFLARAARAVAGEGAVDTAVAPVMGAEDFSFMLNRRPGAYILLGNGDSAGLHHPAYDFNDAAIPYGVSLWAEVIERGMPG